MEWRRYIGIVIGTGIGLEIEVACFITDGDFGLCTMVINYGN